MTGPSGGDSLLTSYEAVQAVCVAAVRDAIAANEVQQQAAQAWLDASLPEPASPVGGTDARL